MNGATAKTVKLPLRFLGQGKYQTLLVRDRLEEAAAVKLDRSTSSRNEALTIEMRAGGFIARFAR